MNKPFDEMFYKIAYGNLLNGKKPLDHYACEGEALSLYTSEADVDLDIARIEASGQFDRKHYQAQVGARTDPIYDYLLNSHRDNFSPNIEFDVSFFRSYYRRSIPRGLHPFLFYCLNVGQPWCFPRFEAVNAFARILTSSPLMDAEWFSRIYLRNDLSLDPVVYFCTEGFRLMMDPSENFNTRSYFIQYPDIVRANMNPLYHFITFGEKEGRSAFSKNSVVSKHKNGNVISNSKKTILIVCHEASRSGAPIVGLNLIKSLRKRYNIISLLMRGGVLEAQFVSQSTAVYYGDGRPGNIEACIHAITTNHKIHCAIINSIVSVPALESIIGRDIPCISLIHEFSQYIRPGEYISRAVSLSDEVVVPAEVVKDAIFDEMKSFGISHKSLNINILPQGQSSATDRGAGQMTSEDIFRALGVEASDSKGVKIVLGAGSVQPRKGVDLFIETARCVRRTAPEAKIKFVWVGGNFKPDSDYHYSVYLADQIKRSGLTDYVAVFDEQPSLTPFWQVADLFFMSSRLDPYPNVALDALAQELDVICFEKATGIAELSGRLSEFVKVAPYCDTNSAAALILTSLEGSRERSNAAVDQLHSVLDFSRYAAEIDCLISKAEQKTQLAISISNSLLKNNQIDPSWMLNSLPTWLVTDKVGFGNNITGLARIVARLQLNGIPACLPRRGFAICTEGSTFESKEKFYKYVSLTGNSLRLKAQPIVVLALLHSDNDVDSLRTLLSDCSEVDVLHIAYESRERRVDLNKLDEIANTTCFNSFNSLEELNAIVKKVFQDVSSPYVILLRPPSDVSMAVSVHKNRLAALDFVSCCDVNDETYELIFVRSDKMDLDARGRWRASRRLGLGVSERSNGFALGAVIDEDVLILSPNKRFDVTMTLAASFFRGGLYRQQETLWVDGGVDHSAQPDSTWAILETGDAGVIGSYDAMYGYVP